MFIRKLVEYYDTLMKKGLLAPEGYAEREITALIELNEDGTINNIKDCRQNVMIKMKNGKEKEVLKPLKLLYPAQPDANNSFSYLIEHRPENIFGITKVKTKHTDESGKTYTTEEYTTEKCDKKHRLFLEKNLPFFEAIENPNALTKAFIAFAKNWDAEKMFKNGKAQKMLDVFKDFTKEKYAFCLTGKPEELLQDQPEVKEQWEKQSAQQNEGENPVIAYCPVLDKEAPVARLHKKIMKFPGGQASGMLLVSYNNESECSYGREKSYNSNISEEAVEKYGTALNYLISSEGHKFLLDQKILLLFWAEDPDEEAEELARAMIFNENNKMSATSEMLLNELANKFGNGANFEDNKLNTKFCFAGLSANSTRICQRFFYEGTLGHIAENIAKHQAMIYAARKNPDKPVMLYEILNALKKPQEDKKGNEADILYGLLNTIINGMPYPRKIMSKALDRIVHDKKTAETYENIRFGLIQACYNSKHKNKDKDELTMSLDKNNFDQAYLCGRLFACYELAQKNAYDNKLNRTIKDSSFAMAMRYPAKKFAKLNTLFNHHVDRMNEKYRKRYYSLVEEIMEKLEGNIPEHLNENGQAKFVVGYYHQKQALYTPADKNNKNEKGETTND